MELYLLYAVISFSAYYLNPYTPLGKACVIAGFFYLSGVLFAPMFEQASFYAYFLAVAWLDLLLAIMLRINKCPVELQFLSILGAILNLCVMAEVYLFYTDYFLDIYEPTYYAINFSFLTFVVFSHVPRPALSHV